MAAAVERTEPVGAKLQTLFDIWNFTYKDKLNVPARKFSLLNVIIEAHNLQRI